jgi:hypothetical protein
MSIPALISHLVTVGICTVSGTVLCSTGLHGTLLAGIAGLLFGLTARRACGAGVFAQVFAKVAATRHNATVAHRVPKLDRLFSAIANTAPSDILRCRRERWIWRNSIQDNQPSESLTAQINQWLHTCGRIAQFQILEVSCTL